MNAVFRLGFIARKPPWRTPGRGARVPRYYVYTYFVHIVILQNHEIVLGIAVEAAISSNRNTRQVPFS